MKNAIIALLAVAVVGLGAYSYNLNKTVSSEPEEVVEAAPEPAPTITKTEAPPPVVAEDLMEFTDPDDFGSDDDAGKEEAATEQLKKAHELIAALHEENKALEEETKPDIFKGIKQIMETPEIKDMMRQGMSQRAKRDNAGLFRWLDLNPEQEAQVNELLIERGISEIGSGLQWITGNIEESAEQTVLSRQAMHAELEELIGTEKLEVYKYWEDTKNERQSIERLNSRLGDNALDTDTSDELVGMMHSTRGNYEELDHLSKPENFNPRDMTEERRENVLSQVDELHADYVKNAAPILNEEQLTTYEQNLGQQRKELEGFLKFTNGMMNRQTPGE